MRIAQSISISCLPAFPGCSVFSFFVPYALVNPVIKITAASDVNKRFIFLFLLVILPPAARGTLFEKTAPLDPPAKTFD